MTALTLLWLPILLAAVFAFIASSVFHMAPLWHKNEYPALPDEEPRAPPSGRSTCRPVTTWSRATTP
jgi:hypothetical protein